MARERVFVVGHRGMLGRDVVRWLVGNGHGVVTSDARFEGRDTDPLIEAVAVAACPIVVNCAAVLPSRTDTDTQWVVNALLPMRLAATLGADQILVHASTDGVFSGRGGPYRIDDRPDSVDSYGCSKRVGEWAVHFPGVVVIRTSIIGTSAGLLGWLLTQTGEVDGFVNQRWSGITTLEWARRCGDIIAEGDGRSRIEQVASPGLSKFQLLGTAAQAFGLRVRIREAEASETLDRTLVPTIPADPIKDQLDDLLRWSTR